MSTLEPQKDRFCDLVMKGGITSGVVYPRAIGLLSHYYRFRGIGGTSAGAIAAAITAAAEYQRREKDSREGFNLLEDLPTQLQSEVKKGKGKLLSLFQPQPNTRQLFTVLVSALNRGSIENRLFHIFTGMLMAYWPATVLSIALALIVAQNGAWFSAILLLVITL